MTEENGTAHKPPPPPGMAEFDRLLGKLIKVPKSELDAEVKKDRRRRAKRKAAKRAK